MSCVFDLDEFKNRIAIINGNGKKVYYGELSTLYRQMGTFFSENKNPAKNNKKLVFILANNNIETIIGYLAVIQTNNTVMLIEQNIDKELLSNLSNIYKPDFIWRPKKEKVQNVFECYDYELIDSNNDDKPALHSELCVLVSTSGSTGSPKLVKLSTNNIIANAQSIAKYLKLDETERAITNLPIHYVYGLSVINSHLIVGATILLTDIPIVKKEFWEFFKNEGGTSLAGVPYTYELLKKIGFNRMELPSLRYTTQAGGKMDTQLVLEYAKLSREKKFQFYVMYGAAEATARMSYLAPQYTIQKAGSIGKAIPNGSMQIVDEAGVSISKPYVEGELVYTGPNVMMGYAQCREDISKEDELLGVLKTGDMAYYDEDEFYFITGRKSRFLKILGKRINLLDIEMFLNNLGFNCICGGEDDLILIALYMEEPDAMNFDENETFCTIKSQIYHKYKIPIDLIRVFLLNNIPRNSSGKINYHRIFSSELKASDIC